MGKKLLMLLGAGVEQSEAIKMAFDMEVDVLAVDGNPKAIGLNIANYGVSADINNVQEMIKIGKEYGIDGVMTHAVEIPQVVAKVSQELGLPGLDPAVAERATNKFKRIQTFKEKKIPCAKFQTAKSVEEAKAALLDLGFPCVFKPLDNSGARGVIKINKKNEIEKGFKHTLEFSKKNIVLIEEFLEGRQLSTESLVYQNKIHHLAFGDRNYPQGFEPFFVQDGGQIPSLLSKELEKELKYTLNSAINALGIDWGVAKGDIIIDNEGHIHVIEMAVRTSGGRFSSVRVPLALSVNIVKPLIAMSVGLKPDLRFIKPHFKNYVADRFILPKPGKIITINGLNEVRKMHGVCHVYLDDDLRPGNKLNNITDHSLRKGQIIATGNTYSEAIQNVENAVKRIEIVTID